MFKSLELSRGRFEVSLQEILAFVHEHSHAVMVDIMRSGGMGLVFLSGLQFLFWAESILIFKESTLLIVWLTDSRVLWTDKRNIISRYFPLFLFV